MSSRLRNTARWLLLLTVISTLMTGCWDRTEVNDIALVLASGVDKVGKNQYRGSFTIPLPGQMGGEGSSGGGGGTNGSGPYYVDSATGSNFGQAISNLQKRMSRVLFFGHRRTLIIGKNLAETDGVSRALDVVIRNTQTRFNTYLFIAEKDAIDILNSQPHLEKTPSEFLRELSKIELGITLKDFLLNLQAEGSDPVLPVVSSIKTQNQMPETAQEELQMKDIAFFKDDRLVYITNTAETQGAYWLLNKMEKKEQTFTAGPNEQVSATILKGELTKRLSNSGSVPSFRVEVNAEVALHENQSNLNITDQNAAKTLENKLNEDIKRTVMAAVEASLKRKVDVFGFGNYLYRTDNQLWLQWRDQWRDILPRVKVDVEVHSRFKQIGIINNNPEPELK